MKKILYTLFILLAGFKAFAQDTTPVSPTAVSAQFFVTKSGDTIVYIYKGAALGWSRLLRYNEAVLKLDPRSFKGDGKITPLSVRVGDSSATSINNFLVAKNANGDLIELNVNYAVATNKLFGNGVGFQSNVTPTTNNDLIPLSYYNSNKTLYQNLHIGSNTDSVIVLSNDTLKRIAAATLVPTLYNADGTINVTRDVSVGGTLHFDAFGAGFIQLTGADFTGQSTVLNVGGTELDFNFLYSGTTTGLNVNAGGITFRDELNGIGPVAAGSIDTAQMTSHRKAYVTNEWVMGHLGSGATPHAVTFNNSGSGASSGSTFDGSAAKTISYNTIGAQPTLGFTPSHQLRVINRDSTNATTNVSQIEFDNTTGISTTSLGSGKIRVALGSGFKTWKVAGQSNIVAVGEDSVSYVKGFGINLTTDNTSGSKKLNIVSDTTQVKSKAGALADYNVLNTTLSGKLPYTGATADFITNHNISIGTSTPVSQIGIVANSATSTLTFPFLTYDAFGNSITFGQNASSTAHNYFSQIAAAVGLTGTNHGVSGSLAADQQDAIYATTVSNTGHQLFTYEIGTNDRAVYAANTDQQANFANITLAEAAYLAIPNTLKVTGQGGSVSYSGTWTDGTFYGGSLSKVSATNGSTATFSVSGTVVYIAYTMQDSNGGTFSVTVDGVGKGSFNNFGQAGTTILTTATRAYGSGLARITGLSAGSHTVVLTVTSSTAAGNKVYFDWAAGNTGINTTTGPTLVEGLVPNNLTGSAVTFPIYNGIITTNISNLKTDGLNVYTANTYGAINTASDLGGDGVHPNDGGYVHLTSAFLTAIESASGVRRINPLWIKDASGNTVMYTSLDGHTDFGVTNIFRGQLTVGGDRSLPAWGKYGAGFQVQPQTYNDSTTVSGTVVLGAINSFGIPTFSAKNAMTLTNAATVYIDGQPLAGTNMTITNPFAFYVNAGRIALLGPIQTGTNQIGGNFYTNSSTITTGLAAQASILMDGMSTVSTRVIMNGTTNVTIPASNGYVALDIGAQPITTASSGTNALIANVGIRAPVLTLTAGSTVNDFASLYVQGGTSSATNTWNSWFKYKVSRFSGVQVDTLTASKFVTTDANKQLASFDLFGTANTYTAVQNFGANITPGTTNSFTNGTASLTWQKTYSNIVSANSSTALTLATPGATGIIFQTNGTTIGEAFSGGNWVLGASPADNGTDLLQLTGNLNLKTAGNKLKIAEGTNGSVGQTVLVAGTKAITISGLTSSSRAIITVASQAGTVTTTSTYEAACTTNTLTINAVTNAGTNTVNSLDTSTVNYLIVN